MCSINHRNKKSYLVKQELPFYERSERSYNPFCLHRNYIRYSINCSRYSLVLLFFFRNTPFVSDKLIQIHKMISILWKG